MNNLSKIAESSYPEYFSSRWSDVLQNPFWYVVVVICLAGSTVYLRFWWWLTGAVALLWGLWLVWHFFSSKDQSFVDNNETYLQSWLTQALNYRTKINQVLKQAANKNNPLGEQSLMAQIDGWVDVIQALVQRLALLRCDDLIYHELSTVPQIIEALELQLAQTSDATLRAQLEQALTHRRTQLAGLQHLKATVQQAEIQIESTLSLLSTVYSQILTGQSVAHIANSNRFLADVDEEVHRLQDRLEALCEVKEEYLIVG